jgi:hypothetical protein
MAVTNLARRRIEDFLAADVANRQGKKPSQTFLFSSDCLAPEI